MLLVSALDQAEAALLDALAAVRAARGDQTDTLAADRCDLLEVDEAAEMASRTEATIRKGAARYGLGRRLGGRWLLSRAKVEAFLRGDAL